MLVELCDTPCIRSLSLSPHVKTRVCAEVMAQLLVLASSGILHKDVDLDNICIHNGRPTLIDFGIAKPACVTHAVEYEPSGHPATASLNVIPATPDGHFSERGVARSVWHDIESLAWSAIQWLCPELFPVPPAEEYAFGHYGRLHADWLASETEDDPPEVRRWRGVVTHCRELQGHDALGERGREMVPGAREDILALFRRVAPVPGISGGELAEYWDSVGPILTSGE